MKKMILKCVFWLLLVLPLRTVTAAEDLPKPFSFTRYQSMSDHSPFAVATALAPPAETPNFAKDLYVANAAHSKEGDFVTIASSTDRNFKKYLTTTMAVDGYAIAGIEWSDKVGATKVTISKDGQTATLSFNEALLRAPAGGGNPPPGSVPGGPKVSETNPKETKDGSMANAAAAPAPGAQPAAAPTKPMPVPALPPPAAPRTRGVIPRNPAAPAPAMKPAAPPKQS